MIFLYKHYVQVIINALVTENNPQVLERANHMLVDWKWANNSLCMIYS